MKDNEDTSANDDKQKEICAKIEDIEHEISMEEARHSDESLRLTRRLRALEEELEPGQDEFEDLEA